MNFRKSGIIHLILVLFLAIPAGFVLIARDDYSGRRKIENVSSKRHKTFVGFHFLKCHGQLVAGLKNKLSFKYQIREYGRYFNLQFKNLWFDYLLIKDNLTVFFRFVLCSINKDVEKLTLAKREIALFNHIINFKHYYNEFNFN